MESFGVLHRKCRQAAKLTQAEIGTKLGKTAGTINRIENENGAALPTSSDIMILLNLFREKGVQESLLVSMEKAWELASNIDGKSQFSIENSTISLAIKTIEDLEEKDKIAFGKDLEAVIHLWRTYHEIDVNFLGFGKGYYYTENRYNSLLDEIKLVEPFYLEARARRKRGIQRRYLANIEVARRDYFESLEIARKLNDQIFEAVLLIDIGDLYRRSIIEELSQAIEYYKEADHIYDVLKIDNPIPKIKIASCLIIGGNPIDALDYCENGLKLAKMTGREDSERKAMEYIAWAKSMMGYFDDALEIQQNAHLKAIDMGLHPKDLAKSCNYLAGYYLDCGLFGDAEKCFEESLNYIKMMREKIPSESGEKELFIRGCILQGLGRVCMEKSGKQLQAEKYLTESKDIGEQLNEYITVGYSNELLGKLNLMEGNLENARRKFLAAKIYYQKSGLSKIDQMDKCNPYRLTGLEISFAELELQSNNLSEAKLHINEAIKMASEYKFLGYQIVGKLWLTRIELLQSSSDVDNVLELSLTALEDTLKTGTYLLKSTLKIITDHILQHYNKNHDLAIKIVENITHLWPNEIKELKPNKDQNYVLDTFFNTLGTYYNEWVIIQRSSMKSDV